jgi:vancomycin resistance protein YoaR
MTEASRQRQGRDARGGGSRRRLAVAGVAALLVVAGVGVAIAAGGAGGGAPGAVSVDGVDVSGESRAEVVEAVRERAKELVREPLVITRTDAPGFRVAATRAELGARPRVKAAVDEAMEPRNLGGRILSRLGIAPTRDVAIEFTLDRARATALIHRVTGRVNDPARSARLEVTADDIALTPAKAGFGIDPEALRAQIMALPDEIAVTPGPLAPAVGDSAAAAARRQALALVAAPVDVTLQGRGVAIEPEVLRSALRFVEDPPRLRVDLDPDTLYEDIAPAFETRETPARDAEFRVSGSSVRLIPSRIGRSLDMRAIADAIVASPGAASVRARFRVTRPEDTTAEARKLRITEQISEFTTPYNCCEPRVTNIQRAAEILDGMIIPAGGRFSLNEALGERTIEGGFVEAPQIAAGRLEDAVGGGVSQVATTMYNAAFFGGMQLIAHTPHQFWISRYPEGREATVSLGGPELVFDNDWDAAVLISASAGSNGITIRLFSSLLGRRVETETGERRDIVEPKEIETVDPDLEPGERVVKQQMGGIGFTVSYTRTVHVGDTLKRDETYTWSYDAQDAFVEVGPKGPKRPGPRGGRTPTAPDEPTTTTPAPTTPGPQPEPDPEPSTPSGGGSAPPPPG